MLDEPTNHLDVRRSSGSRQRCRAPGALIVTSTTGLSSTALCTELGVARPKLSLSWQLFGLRAQREERDARRARTRHAAAPSASASSMQRYRSHRKFPKMHEHEGRLERWQAAAMPTAQGRRLALSRRPGGPAPAERDRTRAEKLISGFAGKPAARVERLEARPGERSARRAQRFRQDRRSCARLPASCPARRLADTGPRRADRLSRADPPAPMPGATVLDVLTTGGGIERGRPAHIWPASCSAARTSSSHREALRWRAIAARAGAAGPYAGEPAAARRAHQPPRHPGARGARAVPARDPVDGCAGIA